MNEKQIFKVLNQQFTALFTHEKADGHTLVSEFRKGASVSDLSSVYAEQSDLIEDLLRAELSRFENKKQEILARPATKRDCRNLTCPNNDKSHTPDYTRVIFCSDYCKDKQIRLMLALIPLGAILGNHTITTAAEQQLEEISEQSIVIGDFWLDEFIEKSERTEQEWLEAIG